MRDKNKFNRKPFARVKVKDNIQPYDGNDAVYTDGDLADDADIKIDMNDTDKESGNDYVKSFVNIIKNKVSKQQVPEGSPKSYEADEENETDEFDHQAEAAFDYFRGITRKIENLKKTVSDAVRLSENGSTGKNIRLEQNFSKYMNDVNIRLEEINSLLDKRMEQINASTGDIKNGVFELDEKTKGSYDEISRGIQNVTKTTEENVGKISELSDTVRGVKERVNEIHTTTNSFDKLYDSIFEFKMSISGMKTEIDVLAKKQKTIFIVVLILLIVSLLISITTLLLSL